MFHDMTKHIFFLFLNEIILESSVVICSSVAATPRHDMSSLGSHVHYYVHFAVVKSYIGKILRALLIIIIKKFPVNDRKMEPVVFCTRQ